MISIRNNMFETNSSSANVLIIPKNQGIHIPKQFIFVDDETSLKPSEKVLYIILNDSHSSKDDAYKMVNFLYNIGVEEIIYGGHNRYFQEAIDIFKNKFEDMGVPDGWTKDVLILAMFGNETELNHYRDGDSRPTWDNEPDENNYYRTYHSDY